MDTMNLKRIELYMKIGMLVSLIVLLSSLMSFSVNPCDYCSFSVPDLMKDYADICLSEPSFDFGSISSLKSSLPN